MKKILIVTLSILTSWFSALNAAETVKIGVLYPLTGPVAQVGKDAVAAYGIGTRIEQIILLLMVGLNISTLSITMIIGMLTRKCQFVVQTIFFTVRGVFLHPVSQFLFFRLVIKLLLGSLNDF